MRFFCLTLLFATLTASAEVYNYQVNYKWGFIDKEAATGTIETRVEGDHFYATLVGQSVSIGDRIYMVRDTLSAKITEMPNGMPSQITDYSVGYYMKPHTSVYDQGLGDNFYNSPCNFRTTTGRGTLDASSTTMEAIAITTDMLSLFRIGQMINFSALNQNSNIVIPITNGGSSMPLNINYLGVSQFDGQPTYEIVFRYYYDSSPSRFPVQCQIRQADRVPVYFCAELPIGHVEMSLTN